MHDVKTRNIGLSRSYIATLAAMDGCGGRARTVATALAALAVLTGPAPAALAQSAGDNQYADPLVTDDGGDQSGQRSPAAPKDDTPSHTGDRAEGDHPPGAVPKRTGDGRPRPTTAPAAEATLPHTGAEPLALAAAGLVLVALGTLGLALARRGRHARG